MEARYRQRCVISGVIVVGAASGDSARCGDRVLRLWGRGTWEETDCRTASSTAADSRTGQTITGAQAQHCTIECTVTSIRRVKCVGSERRCFGDSHSN
jgi:hypothetical protein